MKKWEYCCYDTDIVVAGRELNAFGDDGWELITWREIDFPDSLGNTTTYVKYIFKREKIEEVKPVDND